MLFQIGGNETSISAALLTESDGAQLQDLCIRCTDYYHLVTGLPPGPAEFQSLYLCLPEGKDYRDKFLIGLFKEPQVDLIGVIDAIADYPQKGTWFLGLLLLSPEQRGTGYGATIYKQFAAWVKEKGGEHMRLAVLACNTRAYRFWQSQGFTLAETKADMKFGNCRSDAYVMTRPI